MRSLVPVLVSICLLSPAPATAMSLVGQNVTVTFDEPGFPDETDVVAVGAGVELAFGDGSNIGDNIFLDGEFIDIAALSITFQIRGDGGAHGTPGYQTTGFHPDARYVFSGLLFGVPGAITGLTVNLTDVIGVAVGSELTFNNNQIFLDVGTLGVLEQAGPDLGTIEMTIEFTVPEPGVAALLLLGAAGVWLRRRTR